MAPLRTAIKLGAPAQFGLVALGLLSIAGSVALEIFSLVHTTVTKVVPDAAMPAKTTTIVNAGAPDASVITGLFTLGAVLILAGACYARLTSISVDGVEFDFATQKKLIDKIAAHPGADDAAKQRAYSYALGKMSSATPRTARRASYVVAVRPSTSTDDGLDALVSNAFAQT